ncbi:MAG: HEAT repeat domain-containing protein [Sandaracinaceae bacterium]|nr:HEAT repeat domain-containing protein [Sandaracinaceae bacterium]
MLSGVVGVPHAQAQRGHSRARGRTAQAAPPSITDATRAKLASSDAGALEEALMELVQVGTPDAAVLIAERLRQGLPRALVVHFVETLGVLGHASAGPALIEVGLPHRHPDVRAAAIRAVQACRPPGAALAIRARLSDPAPSVRAAAAVALGGLHDHDSVEPLFLVLDRHLYEAAPSLASLVQGDEIRRLTAYVGRLPFDVMSPALTELFAREDISERNKLDLVAQLQELGTAEVKVFLEDLADSIPAQGRDARVRQAASDAAMRIVD